uniref:DDE Tnp4 domain-containing protein n=1 Tax=Ixodes ricinus TaxID=34613 RepID=A0A0K8RD06_IXORI
MQQEMKLQNILYSPYKRSTTLKGLVGVAPNGVVTYVSKLYPGSNTDKDIVKDCGVLKQLVTKGNLSTLTDKGFLIRDLLPPGVSRNIPPFLSTPQFTPQQS